MKLTIHYSVTLLLAFVAALSNIQKVHGAIYIDYTVFCSDIDATTSKNVTSATVCAYGTFSSPSPAYQPENDTISYIGGYTNTYTIVKPDVVKEGDMATGTDVDEAGIEIVVSRDDDDVCTGITVTLTFTEETTSSISITPCDSCTYCGNETYSYDCSNIFNGRVSKVCETATNDIVFFPLTSDAIHKNAPGNDNSNDNDEDTGSDGDLSIIWGWIVSIWNAVSGVVG